MAFGGENYRIVSRIGSGGVGTTFKVVQVDRTQGELGTYVAKVVRNEETGQRVLDAHKLVRSHLSRSTSLSTIFEVAAEWRENSFVALLAWVEGEPLSEYLGVMQPDSDEALARTWLRTACEALGVLHINGLVHGDISPRNILVSGSGIVLTDYDFVTKIGERADAPGTVAYCPPSFGEGRVAAPSDDLYALAGSFFHVLFEREPFQHNGDRAKERGLNWAGVERGNYPLLAGVPGSSHAPEPGEALRQCRGCTGDVEPIRA